MTHQGLPTAGRETAPVTGGIALPPPPPATPPRPHRKWILVATVIAVVATTVGVGTVARLGDRRLPPGAVIVNERFDDPANVDFWVGADETLAASVADGSYRIEIKDPTAPQIMRHIESRPFGSARFESTVTFAPSTQGVSMLGLGCWSGDHAYLFMTLATGEMGIADRTEAAGQKMRELSTVAEPSSFRPGEANRLRFDCYGATETKPAVLSAYVNGDPVLSVKVEDGMTSFERVGFFVVASRSGSVFTVDDAYAVVEGSDALAPTGSPVEPTATSIPGAFDGFGVHLRYPITWIRMNTQLAGPGVAFGPASAVGDEWIAVSVLTHKPYVLNTDRLMAMNARTLFETIASEGGGGTGRLGLMQPIDVADVSGFSGSIQGRTGSSGQDLDRQLVVLFDGSTWYLLVCQYGPEAEATMLPIWDRFLDSIQIDT